VSDGKQLIETDTGIQWQKKHILCTEANHRGGYFFCWSCVPSSTSSSETFIKR